MYLYRKCRGGVTLLALGIALLALPVAGQWRAPRPERKSARALAVLEIYPNGARRLVPVTLFYEGRYYNAAFYRSAPVPFTLSPETVYEVQRFGKPLGTFTVWGAARVGESAWVGNGAYRAAPDGLAKTNKAPAPVVVEDPSRPVLHRREGSEGDRQVAKKPNPAANEEDPERPKLHRREAPADRTASATSLPDTSTSDRSPQTDQQANRSAADAVAASAEAPDPGPDHPILRRGKPLEEQSGHDLPGQANGPAGKNQEPVERQVAVSDAGPSERRELLFAWAEPQRLRMESGARELARSELLRLGPARGLSMAAAPSPFPARFEDEQFVPYDLDYKDYATVVFSARYRPSAPGAASVAGAVAAPATATKQSWVVTVIARQDGDKLVKLYSAVSDPRELDLYPEVRLVDAVDPEGYGRFALLLREQKRDGVSWLLGRVTGYELQTVFETAAR